MTLGRQSARTAKTKKAEQNPNKTAKNFRPTVTAEMNVMDVIALHPKAGEILGEYGLHCFQCAFNAMDSVGAGAKSHGIPIVIDTDSHSTNGFEVLRYGVDQARRAGLTKDDVANTRAWPEFKKLLRKS